MGIILCIFEKRFAGITSIGVVVGFIRYDDFYSRRSHCRFIDKVFVRAL